MSDLIIKNIQTLVLGQSSEAPLRGKSMLQLPSLSNAYLYCKAGRIADWGSMNDLPEPYLQAQESYDASGRVVLPAWADSHSHLVFAGTREQEFADRIQGLSYEEIAARGGGILNSAAKLRSMSEDELFEAAKIRLKELIEMGTGALEIKSGYGLNPEAELKMLRVAQRLADLNWIPIKRTLLAAHAIPPEFKGDKQGYMDQVCNEILPAVAKEKLADYVDIFCEKGYFDVKDTIRMVEAGASYGLKAKVHVNQFNVLDAIPPLVQNHCLSVDHLEVVSKGDIQALSEGNTIATALPGCSLFLSLPYTPARELIDANVPVALASDYNPGSAPSGNMNLVVALACFKMNLMPEESINAATINGAHAMELGHEVGSIAKGKLAQLIITKPMESYSYIPYAFGHHPVDQMVIQGKLWKS